MEGENNHYSEGRAPQFDRLDPAKREIRLLQVRKKAGDGPNVLQTRLITASLLDPSHQPYKALSYVWFDQTPTYDPELISNLKIREDGYSPIATLQKNALAALLQIAEEDNILTIWIDAVCINQEDNEERGFQVGMMSSIYQNAEEIIAWLGPDSEFNGVGFQVIDGLAAFAEKYFQERWFQWCSRSKVPAEERRPDQYYPGPNGEKIAAWDKVLEAARTSLPEWFEPDDADGRPAKKIYDFIMMGVSTLWTRAWIFQELAFSRKARIQSGSFSTTFANVLMAMKTWHGLQAAAEYATVFGSGSRSGPVSSHWNPGEQALTPFYRGSLTGHTPFRIMLGAIIEVREDDGPAVPMPTLSLHLLIRFADLDATDPRDKVFALWGFVTEGPNTWLLRPDYSLSTEEVYSRAARYMVTTDRRLTTLFSHSHGTSLYRSYSRMTFKNLAIETVPLDLPTWVPDWREATINHTLRLSSEWLHERHKGEQPVYNDEEFERLVQFSEDGRILKIKGIKVGEIHEVFGGDMFPYPQKSDQDHKDDVDKGAALSFRDAFANFVKLTAHGKEIICQYFRFVFRSSEGSTTAIFDHATDISKPIEIMKFLDGGDRILITDEAALGTRIIRFLARLIGENDLFQFRSSGVPVEEMLSLEGLTTNDISESAAVEKYLSSDMHGEVALSKWWDAMMSAFDDFQAWPAFLKNRTRADACGAGMSDEDRESSMKEVQAWTGTTKFKFFIVPGFGLGVCPSCVQPEKGDVVFRPAAHDGPMVLRPAGNGTYKHVGECFVSHTLVRAMDEQETMQSMMSLLQWVEIV